MTGRSSIPRGRRYQAIDPSDPPVTATQRLDIRKVDPAAYQPMLALEKYIHAGTLGEALLGS